jgi:hypothetical protein
MPPCKAKLNGPCAFGHLTTSSQGARGEPRWHQVPDGKQWRGADSGDVICFASFQRMQSGDELRDKKSKPTRENVDDYFDMIRSKRLKLALCEEENVEIDIPATNAANEALAQILDRASIINCKDNNDTKHFVGVEDPVPCAHNSLTINSQKKSCPTKFSQSY